MRKSKRPPREGWSWFHLTVEKNFTLLFNDLQLFVFVALHHVDEVHTLHIITSNFQRLTRHKVSKCLHRSAGHVEYFQADLVFYVIAFNLQGKLIFARVRVRLKVKLVEDNKFSFGLSCHWRSCCGRCPSSKSAMHHKV